MSVQVRFLVESLIAALIRANEWLLTSVDFHVSSKSRGPRKAPTTLITFVWLLTSVDFHVISKNRVPTEGPITFITFKGLLTGVDSNMMDE